MPDPQFAKDLQASEDRTAAKIEADYLSSIRQTSDDTDWPDIEHRLASLQQPEDVANAVSWADFSPMILIESLFNRATGIQEKYISGVLKFDFKLTDPNSIKWLKEYGANEIKYISDSQRQAIKEIVTRGYADGVTYQQQAKEIKQLIGLDSRRAEAVQRMREKLMNRGLISDSQIDRQAERYAEEAAQTASADHRRPRGHGGRREGIL